LVSGQGIWKLVSGQVTLTLGGELVTVKLVDGREILKPADGQGTEKGTVNP
jgi:translation initiation factor IF-1